MSVQRYSHYSQSDVDLGTKYETRMKPHLEVLFGSLTQRSAADPDDTFDFSNERVYIDAKCRRNTKDRYPTTMVGNNKVLSGFNLMMRGYRVFFLFGFTDGDYLWELHRDQYEVRHGGRFDRGTPEIKSYCYVPVKYLRQVITDATLEEETTLRLEQAPGSTPQEAPEQVDEGMYEGGSEDLH